MDVVESLQYKAQEEDVEILVKDFHKDVRILADRNQIKQVLVNLIENGMKYNKPGGYVEIGIQDAEGDPSRLELYEIGRASCRERVVRLVEDRCSKDEM